MIIQGNDPYTQPSFSLQNRIMRAVWEVAWLILFRTSPRPFNVWRRFLLRLFGARLGKHVNVYPTVRIWAPWALDIGNFVGVADGVKLYNMASIKIGDYCVISQGAHLCSGSHDVDSSNFQLIAKPISLECYVWVCAEAFVGPGVKLAEGCVLGARAVVVKSIVEPWTVWAGNPGLKKRLRKKVIE
jgi:putative colanic acid biosynthesis acetyltransferase WcaF